MGILDDAIREHLELKRRRGVDPAEVERAEREALGPVRRQPQPGDASEERHEREPGVAYEDDPEQSDGPAREQSPESSNDEADTASHRAAPHPAGNEQESLAENDDADVHSPAERPGAVRARPPADR